MSDRNMIVQKIVLIMKKKIQLQSEIQAPT